MNFFVICHNDDHQSDWRYWIVFELRHFNTRSNILLIAENLQRTKKKAPVNYLVAAIQWNLAFIRQIPVEMLIIYRVESKYKQSNYRYIIISYRKWLNVSNAIQFMHETEWKQLLIQDTVYARSVCSNESQVERLLWRKTSESESSRIGLLVTNNIPSESEICDNKLGQYNSVDIFSMTEH